MLNTVLSSRVSRVSAMVSVRFSGMFNMVQEFGTAVYRIAKIFIMFNVNCIGIGLSSESRLWCVPVYVCVYCKR